MSWRGFCHHQADPAWPAQPDNTASPGFGRDHGFNNQPPVLASRTAMACLLLRSESGDLALAAELAQTAVVAGVDHPFVRYYQHTKGMAEYRQGHYAGAKDWLRKSLAGDKSENLTLPARLLLAMTFHQLGKTNEARFALDEALTRAERSYLSRSPGPDFFTDYWLDVLTFQILREEAKALIGTDRTADGQPFLPFSEVVRLMNEGEPPEAEAALREAVTRYKALFGPDHPETLTVQGELAIAYSKAGKLDQALPLFEETLKLQKAKLGPDHPDTLGTIGNLGLSLCHLAQVLHKQGKLPEAEQKAREALDHLRKAAETGESMSRNNLAWYLATSPFSAIRDGRNAVTFAQKAVSATGRANPLCLNTLAAACAEAGEFADAVTFQREAIALLPEGRERDDCVSRLKAYESNSPWREP